MGKKHKITAHLPTVELSRRSANKAMRIDVNRKGKKVGGLVIAEGSVQWWPDYTKNFSHEMPWKEFIRLLEKDMPKRRAKRWW